MKVVLTIFLLGLCGSIYANQAVFNELAQINENPFGATVLAALSANMRAKTPIDDISALLTQILNDLLGDRQDLDTYYTTTKASLQNAITDNTRIRDSYKTAAEQLDRTIQEDEGSRTTKQTIVDGLVPTIASTELRITNLDNARTTYINNADADLDDLSKAIAACREAIAKMGTYQNAITTSLLQVASSAKRELKTFSSKMDGLKTKLAKHGSMYAPLIHELISLTENPESDKAGRIINLLNQLLSLLLKAHTDLSLQRAEYETSYQTNRAQAVKDLEGYKTQKTQLESEIEGLNTRINNNKQSLANTQELLRGAEATLKQNYDDLDALETKYATEGPKYDALIAIVRKIIAHFNENISSVDEWTQQQINGF